MIDSGLRTQAGKWNIFFVCLVEPVESEVTHEIVTECAENRETFVLQLSRREAGEFCSEMKEEVFVVESDCVRRAALRVCRIEGLGKRVIVYSGNCIKKR